MRQILQKPSILFWLCGILMLTSCHSHQVITLKITSKQIHFSDMHNSVISRMFTQKNMAGLELENYAVSRKKYEMWADNF